MVNRRTPRKPQPRAVTSSSAPAQTAPAPSPPMPQAEPVWNPPTPRAVARLGSEQRAALDRLAALALDLQRRQDALAEKVATARAHGVSWAGIGYAVGTSGEAARQRWGGSRD